MNIENAQYEKNLLGDVELIKATIDGETLYVSLDSDNRHYVAILEWAKEDGNTIKEAD
tara:strand:- start:201 stop:374 length:174 start_codon:yes stop_codon:yes gene_type:complete